MQVTAPKVQDRCTELGVIVSSDFALFWFVLKVYFTSVEHLRQDVQYSGYDLPFATRTSKEIDVRSGNMKFNSFRTHWINFVS